MVIRFPATSRTISCCFSFSVAAAARRHYLKFSYCSVLFAGRPVGHLMPCNASIARAVAYMDKVVCTHRKQCRDYGMREKHMGISASSKILLGVNGYWDGVHVVCTNVYKYIHAHGELASCLPCISCELHIGGLMRIITALPTTLVDEGTRF